MEALTTQTFTEILHKELAPIKLGILEIKEELRQSKRRDDNLDLRIHGIEVQNERTEDHIAVLAENIGTAAENRGMILDLNSQVRVLEAA